VAAALASTGTLDIEGNCTGGSGSNAHAVSTSSSGNIVITGNLQGAAGAGLFHNGTGTATITGNATGGTATGVVGLLMNATNTVVMTGNCLAGGTATVTHGLTNGGAGTATITGNATGSGGSFGVNNTGSGTINLIGSAIAGAAATSHGANNNSTGTLSVIRAVGNAYGIGAAGGTGLAYGLNSANIASDSRAEELEYGENGAAPTFGAVKIVAATNNKCIVELTTSAQKTLADPSDGTGQANEADVRSGTVYALGNLTGTCAVPAAGSVALGVAVDATTGTAVLTPAAVWDALTSGMTTSGSIGARLKNAATLDSTGQQLADALSPVP
jgi:hypothetical protein